MSFFRKKILTTINNIESRLSSEASYRIASTHGSSVSVDFIVLEYTITSTEDEDNFDGHVVYEIDTSLGGGPGKVSTTFFVENRKIQIDIDSIDFDSNLDIEIIDEQNDIDYGDGELDSDDDWE